jgi:murein DD-endopeptidase MepM/ murein hydrolase activator NlpD
VTHATLIPFLTHTGLYWFADTYVGGTMPSITKMVLHSTETPPPNCPGYSGGSSAPTLTLDPWAQRGWQHFPANMSARALQDPSSTPVRENRDNVAQIEIIGYADYRINAQYALGNIPEAGLLFIAQVLRWYADEGWGLPLTTSLEWPTFGSPRINSVRLSGSAYDAYTGVLGHMHVSGNSHVDPAGLDVGRVLALAGGNITTPPPSGGGGGGGGSNVTVNGGDCWIGYLVYGKNDSDSVKRMQEALNATSFPPYTNIPVTGNYGDITDKAVRDWQISIGNTPDPAGRSSIGSKQAHKLFAPFPQVTLKEGTPGDVVITPPPSSGGTGNITTPFPGARITTPYGKPGKWAAGYHTGDDYACPVGTPLRTMWTSRVVRIGGWGAAYGTHVIVEFVTGGQTRQMAFCHMSSVSVRVGQTLRPGDNVGRSGNTGNTTGPHLHLEQRTAPYGYNNKCQRPVY